MYSNQDKAMTGTQHRGFVLASAACLVLTIVYSGTYLGRAAGERLEVAEEKVNPNTADAASLMRLPNIGPARAEAIIAYRQSAAPPAFEKAEDLEKVKGIGPKTVEGMRPWLGFD
jgi:competence protein ComEA